MSWFKRKREFTEDADALADDVDTEFDTIAEALNSMVAADVVASSKALSAVIIGSTEYEVPGTSRTFALSRPSIVVVTAFWDFELSTGTGAGKSFLQGLLNVDGANQTAPADLGLKQESFVQATVGETFRLKLGAGSHTLKLKIHADESTGPSSSFTCWSAQCTYIILPDPGA